MATRRQKRAAKPVKKRAAKKLVPKKVVPKKAAKKKQAAAVRIDLSDFPPESVISSERSLCVACVWQIFTRAMSLTPKIALSEMKRYTPTIEELTSGEVLRPFFVPPEKIAQEKQPRPYCGSPAKWHARIETH